jgi:malonyl-CoA O-methyltransferase
LVALDLDAALVAAARRRLGPEAGISFLVADGETPIRGGYDLIIANATFQWFTRPDETLAAYHQSLLPGGVLAFSTLGPGTFQELAGALAQAARSLGLPAPPPIPAQGFGDRETWADRLARAGFRKTRLTRKMHTATFPSVPEFLKALQATGATNPRPGPLSPRLLQALIAAYESGYGRDGAIPVSYEMLWAVAEK